MFLFISIEERLVSLFLKVLSSGMLLLIIIWNWEKKNKINKNKRLLIWFNKIFYII